MQLSAPRCSLPSEAPPSSPHPPISLLPPSRSQPSPPPPPQLPSTSPASPPSPGNPSPPRHLPLSLIPLRPPLPAGVGAAADSAAGRSDLRCSQPHSAGGAGRQYEQRGLLTGRVHLRAGERPLPSLPSSGPCCIGSGEATTLPDGLSGLVIPDSAVLTGVVRPHSSLLCLRVPRAPEPFGLCAARFS